MSLSSFALLYEADRIQKCWIKCLVLANTWFWSYEINNVNVAVLLSFDCYSIGSTDLLFGQFRLISLAALILPTQAWIRLVVTSISVIHSWGINSFGLKFDAISGKLSSV